MVNDFTLPFSCGEIKVNKADRSNLLDEVRSRFRRGEGFAIATLNLDHMVKLAQSPDFHAAYQQHDLVVADGNPIVWLSRLAGQPVSLVAGSDLVDPLAALASAEGKSVMLFGATEETLALAAAELSARHPGLTIVGCLSPSRNFDPYGLEADRLIEAMRRSGAALTFIALGAPKQEIFAARCRDLIPGMGFASVGAGIDFIAKKQRRAPIWMRRLAIEWLWRLAHEPRRLTRRYALCAAAFPGLALGVLAYGWSNSSIDASHGAPAGTPAE